jgi:hypothetical protein
VKNALDWSLALGKQLGLRFQPLKVFGPATQLDYLGLNLDTIAMEVRLPPEKLTYLLDLLASWSQRTHCRLHELQELTGFLQFSSQVVLTSRAFLRSLYDFSTQFKTSFTRRRIPKSARHDIECGTVSLPSGTVFGSSHLLAIPFALMPAASKASADGGHFGSDWFSARCPRRYRHEHIQVKEMLAVVHAILCWGDAFTGKHVIFHSDNEAVSMLSQHFPSALLRRCCSCDLDQPATLPCILMPLGLYVHGQLAFLQRKCHRRRRLSLRLQAHV